jgi:hypothetical protein
MYVLITQAENEPGNRAATVGDALAIALGVAPNTSDSYHDQVFKTGEIVLQDQRCCPGGRKYWKWGIDYEEGFDSIEAAVRRAKDLGIEPTVHERCAS